MGGFLDGGLPLLRQSTALESELRESWIRLSSRVVGRVPSAGAWASLWPVMSLMIGWSMKVWRWGFIRASLFEGSVAMIALRI